jgi:hypothetical protein
MKRFIAWLKACCTLQHPREGEMVLLTTFGRAHAASSRKWHPGWMMYWVKLPCFEWQQDFCTLQYGWHQAVLRFHGAFGFEIFWVWVQGQDIVRHEQDDYL